MGGTGKTPHVEYIVRILKGSNKVATLSRGFGRKERGFIIADDDSTANQIGDEPLQFYKKYGDEVVVSVEADRVLGAMDLFRIHPEIEVLLLDDAFQHQAIKPSLNILLTDYHRPFFNDFILPVGNLRESRAGKKRADIIIVTKCPALSAEKKSNIVKNISPSSTQTVFFSSLKYTSLKSFLGEDVELKGREVILVSGIANATRLVQKLSTTNNIIKHFEFGDHHKFKVSELREIHNIFDKFAERNPLIITTEKDAMRLISDNDLNEIEKYPWCYQSIEVELDRKEEFEKLITNHVKENNTNS
jgi:tetraacyldisaccharide 4'-kinase